MAFTIENASAADLNTENRTDGNRQAFFSDARVNGLTNNLLIDPGSDVSSLSETAFCG